MLDVNRLIQANMRRLRRGLRVDVLVSLHLVLSLLHQPSSEAQPEMTQVNVYVCVGIINVGES